MRFRYTEQQVAFLRTEYPRMDVRALTAAFNQQFRTCQSIESIKSTLERNKIRSGRKPGNPKGTFRLFTPKQAAYIADAYKNTPCKEIADALNECFGTRFTNKQINNFVSNHRLQSGRTGRYEPGNSPWNEGTKGLQLTIANKTSFGPNNRPHNTRPIGSERVNRDGYRERKIAETGDNKKDWKPVHRIVWAEHNGPIPADHAVIFIDGDKANTDIANLALISRAALARFNRSRYGSYPRELKPSVIALAKLETLISERERTRET